MVWLKHGRLYHDRPLQTWELALIFINLVRKLFLMSTDGDLHLNYTRVTVNINLVQFLCRSGTVYLEIWMSASNILPDLYNTSSLGV